jgi:dTDP-4-dehydrorhamnose 3,5-epimerase
MQYTPFFGGNPYMSISETGIVGCYLIERTSRRDGSGTLHDLYDSSALRQVGIDFDIHEVLLSTSAKKVLRGLHFQSAPYSTAKLVTCLSGEVFDAVVDLRTKSPTYLKTFTIRLSGADDMMIFIPEGLAHGFYACEDKSTILYMTSGVFSPKHDSGILWNSAGIEWPDPAPIISERDQNLVPLEAFQNPF